MIGHMRVRAGKKVHQIKYIDCGKLIDCISKLFGES